ncbi:HNH endonuclease [Mycobacteroides abscessus]
MSQQRKGIKRPGIGGAKRRSQRTIECAVCDQVVSVTPQQVSDGIRTCSESCRKELISRAKGGLGIGVCESCGVEYQVSRFHLRAGRRFCGDTCRLAWFALQTPTGEDNPFWNGGGVEYYGSSWAAARRAAWERDNETCASCGRSTQELGERPIVHHKIPFKSFGVENHEIANQLDNLTCLCRSCHLKEHWKMRRAN